MRQKKKVGAFIQIPLNNGFHVYGRIGIGMLFIFYDCYTKSDLTIEEITKLPVLFIIYVHRQGVTTGRWKKIGYMPLEDELKKVPFMFTQDSLDFNNLRIYQGFDSRKATYEECLSIEPFAFWNSNHVEDRLQDHYNGEANKWLKSMEIKNPKEYKNLEDLYKKTGSIV